MNDEPDNAPRRRPRAFRLDAIAEPVLVEPRHDPYALEAEAALGKLPPEEVTIEVAQAEGMRRKARFTWGGLFWSALGALASLSFGLWLSRLIDDLFARAVGLGWTGVALAAALGLAALGLATREIVGVFRQSRVARLHEAIAAARVADDRDAARARLKELAALYAARPETARARAELDTAAREIIDGRDLIDIAERVLMLPLDRLASVEIATAAKRVSAVTAISPRALVDVVFVVAQLIRLVRRIAELYSGRPGLLGFLRLARSVGTHLAVTGGMAIGDGLVQQLVGHGIAARLSARLGEGVMNGLLTTRVGLSAMAVCRPMPFGIGKPPGVKEVAPFLFGGEKEARG